MVFAAAEVVGAADVPVDTAFGALEHAASASADAAAIAPMRRVFFMSCFLIPSACSTPGLCVPTIVAGVCFPYPWEGFRSATKRSRSWRGDPTGRLNGGRRVL